MNKKDIVKHLWIILFGNKTIYFVYEIQILIIIYYKNTIILYILHRWEEFLYVHNILHNVFPMRVLFTLAWQRCGVRLKYKYIPQTPLSQQIIQCCILQESFLLKTKSDTTGHRPFRLYKWLETEEREDMTFYVLVFMTWYN